MRKVKILGLDIETAPHTAHVWGLFKQTVGINQIMDTGRVLCASYKWLGEKGVKYVDERGGRKQMLAELHAALSEADILLTYNGKKFDIPTLNKEFLCNGFKPPPPVEHIDAYLVVRRRFRFASNKLDHVARELGIGCKLRHSGHGLWVACMGGDAKSWRKMERYNKRDVIILEKLYTKIQPWVNRHPPVSVSPVGCPSCGSPRLERRGTASSKVATYQRFVCKSCHSWSRSRLATKTPSPLFVSL